MLRKGIGKDGGGFQKSSQARKINYAYGTDGKIPGCNLPLAFPLLTGLLLNEVECSQGAYNKQEI